MDNTEEKYFLTRGKAILFVLIIIVFFIVFSFIKNKNSRSEERYNAFEEELEKAAANYVYIKNIYLDEGEEKKIMLSELFNIYSTDNDLKNKCEGYVIVSSEKNISTKEYETLYNAYIKCSNKYKTPNYSEY